MSQKKVDHYKEQKSNRRNIIKKEKRTQMIERIVGSLIALVLVVWVGFSIYNKFTQVPETEAEKVETLLNIDSINNYLESLTTEEVTEEAETEETATEETATEEAETEEAATEETATEETATEETASEETATEETTAEETAAEETATEETTAEETATEEKAD